MALVNCSECGKEVSDNSNQCIHCGNPLGTKLEPKEQHSSATGTSPHPESLVDDAKTVEDKARTAVDIVFSIFYVFLVYSMIFDEELNAFGSVEDTFGMILAFVVVIFIHKAIRFVIGSVAKSIATVFK